MKDEQIPVHQLEHAEPTVIHHPEEDMTILARWLQRGMEQGARFWLLLGGVVVLLFALAMLSSGIAASKSTTNEAWIELTQAKTVEDRLKIAESHANTPVALWAKLLSAQEEYAYGIENLTSGTSKDTAGPRLATALKLFREVVKEAAKDSPQTLAAMFGAARTLEARNELSLAIEQYRELATKFPNTPEAKLALGFAKALEEPINIQFYKELYAYKAPANPLPGGLGDPSSFLKGTMPPLGTGTRSPGSDIPVPPGLDAPPPAIPVIPPPAETPKAEVPKAETPAPPSAPATPAEPPKTAAPPK